MCILCMTAAPAIEDEVKNLPAAKRAWEVADLTAWDEKIRQKATRFGLDWFPQEFEICDHWEMLGYMAYSGMPAHYPHWSYGKSYERQKTLYDYRVSGLPYELVINTSPSIAYLMKENTLCLQILTIAHVYGHNDFFKNNFTFRHTEPEHRLSHLKLVAERVRDYEEDPSIDIAAIERVLDAAHGLQYQCRRNPAIRKATRREAEEELMREYNEARDPYHAIHARREVEPPDLLRIPLEPEEDLLLMIRDYNPKLEEWERDLLTIVHEEAQYFIPQIETKIMNEGWATFWHHKILNSLELDPDLQIEFIIRHNQVVRPFEGELNPYHLGFRLWTHLYETYLEENDNDEAAAIAALMKIREVDRDPSFIRRFLTPELMREMDIFVAEKKSDKTVVTAVSDEEHWQEVKRELIRNVGVNAMPMIKVVDIDDGGNHTLRLAHEHDSRDLQIDYAEHTLRHVHMLWGRDVVLETVLGEESVTLTYTDEGFKLN